MTFTIGDRAWDRIRVGVLLRPWHNLFHKLGPGGPVVCHVAGSRLANGMLKQVLRYRAQVRIQARRLQWRPLVTHF